MICLPPTLRPRWTWRYILGATGATYLLYCFLFASPLFSSRLPQYTGPYAVGAIDLEAPVAEPRRAHDARFKHNDKPAFQVETVLFTIYYPTTQGTISTKPHHLWVPRPLGLVGAGYARFAHISNIVTDSLFTFGLWALVGRTEIPAQVDVPLHGSGSVVSMSVQTPGGTAQSTSTASDGFPVMVFSHGFASSRTQYTQYLGELASRGFVVAALEHRDGSGPGSIIMKRGSEDEDRVMFALRHLQDGSGLDAETFKQAQLDFRQIEIEETVRVLRHINEGKGDQIFAGNPRGEGRELKLWRGRLGIDNATIGGHSFGATLALQTLKDGPSPALPFGGAVVLDPGKSSGRLNDDVRVPALVVHSNSWSRKRSIFFGRPHFDVVKDVVQGIMARGKDAWFLTSLGTSHPSVTDAPVIEPFLLSWTTGSTIDAHEGVRQYVGVSESFLRYQVTGEMTGLLDECVTHPEYDVKAEGRVLSRIFRKYWQIHAAPCSEAKDD
ncbi:hypothetical protein LTR84_008603 [Exophiala bonariae]|uniref:Putative phospholipase n=1 Tax=Exophiala bonariae TaxID=1690606 RepID=A0AAV9MXG8_9EURO|nr:hypothetical protein LTR84_008603 [Exophiala bonariae]